MARYINENDVYKLVEPNGTAKVHCSQIDELPRADVVPKSEVEELIKSVDDMLDLVCTMTGLELTYYGKYAEFKKKYTEERE